MTAIRKSAVCALVVTFPQPGNDRPLVRLEVSDHPLSRDFHNGMTEERAQAIFEMILHRQNTPH